MSTKKRAMDKATIYKLWPVMGRKSDPSIKNKLRLIKSILLPQMLYAVPVWGHASDTQIEKIQKVQNRVLRNALNAPCFVRNTQLHRDLKLLTIKEQFQELSANFFEKTKRHPAERIQEKS